MICNLCSVKEEHQKDKKNDVNYIYKSSRKFDKSNMIHMTHVNIG